MKLLTDLQRYLDDIKLQVIGIAIYSLDPKTFDLIINIDDDIEGSVVDMIHISPWGAIQKATASKEELHEGVEIVLFPDGKNLTEMLEDSFKFNKFCTKHLG